MTNSEFPYDLRTVGILKVLLKEDRPKRGFVTHAYDNSIELRVDCKDYPQSGRNIQIGRRCKRLITEGYIHLDRKGIYSIGHKGRVTVTYYDKVILPDLTTNLELRMFIEELRVRQVALIASTPEIHTTRGYNKPLSFELTKYSLVVCPDDGGHVVMINESNLFLKEGNIFVYCAEHDRYIELRVVD